MKNIAYKVMNNNPNLPNGFIIDHFETDDDSVAGYIVVPKEAFSALLANNVSLMRQFEINKGIIAADPNQPAHMSRTADKAEPVDPAFAAQVQANQQKAQENTALFAEFLAWKNAQNAGS